MYHEELDVKLMHEDTLIEGKLDLYEEAPDDREQVLVELSFCDKVISKMDNNYFEALQQLRVELEKVNIQILCNGAAKNVYPSTMQMSMGSCRTAYILSHGRQAKSADIVDIFGCLDSLVFVSVAEQKAFYDVWIERFTK